MTLFRYTCLNHNKQQMTDIIEADNWLEANEQLQAQNLIVLTLSPIKQHALQRFNWSRLIPIKLDNLLIFTTQLATLLNADIPVAEALQTLANQSKSKRWQQIILTIREKILEGNSLSISLNQYPNIFSKLYCQSIAAGERAGFLPQVLQGLTLYLEQHRNMQNKVKQALLYPLIMILVSFGVIGFLLFYVMPKIIPLFHAQHQALPWMTKALLSIVGFLHHDWFWIMLVLIIGIFTLVTLLKNNRSATMIDHGLLKLPIIGNILLLANTARFTSTLSFLLNAGVPLVEALNNAKTLVKLLPMQTSIDKIIMAVYQGQSLAQALNDTNYFPPLTVHLIRAGEKTGKLADMLDKAASYHSHELDHKITMLLTLFEPMMILVMGGVVLFIVLAVLLPIFSLDQLAGLH